MVRTLASALRRQMPWLLAAALTLLLGILAVLQQRWLVQVSEAERQRAHAHLESAAAAFARDFNEPLSRLAFDFLPFFQIPREEDALAELLEGRLERWRGTATEPNLLSALWLIGPAGDDDARFEVSRLAEGKGRFETPASLPAPLAELARRLAEEQGERPRGPFRQLPGGAFEVLDENIPALILPLPAGRPDSFAFSPAPAKEARPLPGGDLLFRRPAWRDSSRLVVLELDRRVLEERILPLLAARHFGDQGFGLRVVAKADPGRAIFTAGRPMPAQAKIELAVDLFGPLVFSRSVFLPGRPFEEALAVPGTPVPPPAVAPPAATRPVSPIAAIAPPDAPEPPEPPQGPAVRPAAVPAPTAAPAPVAGPAPPDPPAPRSAPPPLVWLSRDEGPGAPVELGEGRWRLEIFHEDGSLDAAVDRAQRRNLSLALGILLVLGLSMLFLAGTARKAQQLARRQMELVAGVTHELLTPLAAMKSAGQNLRDGVVQEPPKVARYGVLIVKESDRLSGLVGQVLLWAGLASHEAALRREKVDAGALARAALDDLRPGLDNANFEVELAIAGDLPPLEADPTALRQALSNLIANALKYGRSAEGPSFLRVAVEPDPGRPAIRFTVSDRGKGIAGEDLPHLFEPFFRGRRVVASNLAGAGLGLALVRRIAEAHGGEIAVGPAAGGGAAFTLVLPSSPTP